MKTVCLYFQVHQPWRLKKYRFFNMGKDHNYLDDLLNRSIMQKVARQCYLPMNALLLKLIRENKGKFRCSFSITGIAIEQFRAYAPEVLESFKELAATGCVEFLAETYSHSLASLASKEDFTEQVKLHTALIKKEFGVKPTAFRNTELIYSDDIGAAVAEMGFRTMLAEGAKHVLGWKSPNYVYANAVNQKLRLLLRNYKLSDDIAFRFSNRNWDEWPLTADKYVKCSLRTRPRAKSSTSSWTTKPSANTRPPTRESSSSCVRCRRRSSPRKTDWNSRPSPKPPRNTSP